MVFSSISFLFFFLPLAVATYWVTPARFRNVTLLASSLIFYTWGAGDVVVLLTLTTLLDWALARGVDLARERRLPALARGCLLVSVVANLGVLVWFKYSNFLASQLNHALGGGVISFAKIALPIGVSFFTFHRISYIADVSRGRPALKNPLDLLLYILLFPHLIAGPIVRYGVIADELQQRSVTTADFATGVVRFAHGLVKKVVVADSVARIANAAFSLPHGQRTAQVAWLGAIAYTVQIYFDFSGYSDMAIGLARMFGFHFPENFNRPYSSLSITDFWRRWHMTLSQWFRDYLYIPLGGSQRGEFRTYLNLAIVWSLTGFWHGANWTFLAWGAYNGALLMLERATGQRPLSPDGTRLVAIRRIAILGLIVVGWVLFRSPSIADAFDYLGTMLPTHLGSWTAAFSFGRREDAVFLLVGVASFALPGTFSAARIVTEGTAWAARSARLLLAFVAVPYAILLVMGGTFSPFLYFQF